MVQVPQEQVLICWTHFPSGITVKRAINPFQGTVSINNNILSIQNMTVKSRYRYHRCFSYVEPHVLGTLYNKPTSQDFHKHLDQGIFLTSQKQP